MSTIGKNTSTKRCDDRWYKIIPVHLEQKCWKLIIEHVVNDNSNTERSKGFRKVYMCIYKFMQTQAVLLRQVPSAKSFKQHHLFICYYAKLNSFVYGHTVACNLKP